MQPLAQLLPQLHAAELHLVFHPLLLHEIKILPLHTTGYTRLPDIRGRCHTQGRIDHAPPVLPLCLTDQYTQRQVFPCR